MLKILIECIKYKSGAKIFHFHSLPGNVTFKKVTEIQFLI